MKKRFVIAAVAVVAVLAAGYFVYDSVFPKAEKLSFPDETQIISIAVGSDSTAEFPLSADKYELLLPMLNSIAPTRKQSVNDYPYVKPYYSVTVSVPERQYRCFVYSENSQVYVELPYEGVYEADGGLIDFILSNIK